VSALGGIARAAGHLPTPALVVIGEVVSLRETLAALRRSAA
jgi:siroheme synthase